MFRSITAAALCLALTGAAQAQTYPERPVTVIVPFAAGGNADVLGRIFAEKLSARLGKQFVVENRAGAGGNIGGAAVAQAQPDGYTIGVATVTITINPHIYKEKNPYDTVRDFRPLLLMGTQPNIITVHPSVPAKNLAELIAWLKANPGQGYATSGVGTSIHLCMELLSQMTGVQLTHVPYRSSAQVMQDVISGQVKLTCDNASTSLPQIKAGNIRAIGVTSKERSADAPEIPAVAETLPGFEAVSWHSWVASAKIPKPILDVLEKELVAVAAMPDVQKRLRELGVAPSSLAGDAFAEFVKAELAKWGPVVEKAGIKAP